MMPFSLVFVLFNALILDFDVSQVDFINTNEVMDEFEK